MCAHELFAIDQKKLPEIVYHIDKKWRHKRCKS